MSKGTAPIEEMYGRGEVLAGSVELSGVMDGGGQARAVKICEKFSRKESCGWSWPRGQHSKHRGRSVGVSRRGE